MSVVRASVPCGSCRACCKGDAIVLHPECGDVPALYDTEPGINPLTGNPCQLVRKKPNGECIYLGADGCTIHDRAPVICREFDCRRMYLRIPRAERRRLVRLGLFDQSVFDAGRERLPSLEDAA